MDTYREANSIGFIILFFTALLLVVFIFFYIAGGFQFKEKPVIAPAPPPHSNVNYNFGSSLTPNGIDLGNGVQFGDEVTCKAAKNTIWDGTNCSCIDGYYGASCSFPIFSPRYYVLGQKIEGNSNLTTISSKVVKGVSYAPDGTSVNTASGLCDADPTCIGFSYDYKDNTATLYSKYVLPDNSHIIYDDRQPGNIFMKNGISPEFPDRVFLVNKPPLRYWLLDRYDQGDIDTISLLKDTVYKIDFNPEEVINRGGLVGIYSQNPIKYTELESLVQNPPIGVSIVRGNQLPPKNLNLPYYVGYIRG